MNDIDDVLRRTYGPPPDAPAAHPSPERLAAALRAGRRRRARRQAAAGAGAAALTVGLLLGVVALRNGGDAGDGIPADTTSGVSTPTTVFGATASPTSPTTIATTSPGGVPAAPGVPQFVAVSTDGRIEVWARTGLVRSVRACGLVDVGQPCTVDRVAVSDDAVWFVERWGPDGGAHLFWAPLRLDVAASERPLPPDAAQGRLAGVTADGSDVLLLAGGRLVRLRDRNDERIGTAVSSATLSGDGRVAFVEGNRTIVVRSLAGGSEQRIDVEAAAGDDPLPASSSIEMGEWSPDRRRLLLTVTRGEDRSWWSVDLGGSPRLRRLTDTRRVPACWSGADTVAIGAWAPSPGADTRGPIALVSAVDGRRVGSLDGSFGESLAFACRGDGAVAMVQHTGADWSAGGDLVVVGRDGAATRLGIGYDVVLPLGSGPVALLDPATLPAPTTTAAPPMTARTADAFVALTAAGDLEVWTPAGKVRTIPVGVDPCADPATCGPVERVGAVAVTERSVWYGGADGTLWQAGLDGATPPPTKVSVGAGAIAAIAVSADDAAVWFVRRDPTRGALDSTLVRRERGVESEVATDVVSVALSPDGTKLAYSTYTFTGEQGAPTEGSVIGELVVQDLATAAETRRPWAARAGFPPALVDLRWSPDGARLLVASNWEGQRDLVVPADLSTSLDDPTYLGDGSQARSCWIDATTVAQGLWPIVYAEGPSQPADVVAVDVRTGRQTPYGVRVYGDTLACRSDGSVALVDKGASFERPGELVVVRPEGRRTVLGRGYAALFAG